MSNGTEQTSQEVPIEIDWTDEPPPVYANGAQLVHNNTEFAISFTEFANFGGRRSREGSSVPRARVVSSIRLNPDVFFQFVVACASNWNKFVNRVSPEGSKPPKFKLISAGNIQLEGLEPPGEEEE